MKYDNTDKLKEVLASQNVIGEIKQEGELVTAFLNEPIEASAFNKMLFDEGIVLSHLVKRKESLEEQFLQLTDNLAN